MLRAVVALLLAVASEACSAGSVWVNGGLLSIHAKPGFNGVNAGGGLEVEVAPWASAVAGVYQNSVDERNQYAGAFVSREIATNVRAGAMVGVVRGYRGASTAVTTCPAFSECSTTKYPGSRLVLPMLIPAVSVGGSLPVGVNILLVPPIKGVTPATASFQFKLKVWR